MKSLIDWNELVPLLPKQKRDDLYLEALAILSEQDDLDHHEKRPKTRTKKSNSFALRYWRDSGDGHTLSAVGRKYKINKTSDYAPKSTSEIGKLWGYLVKSERDIITYEGLASIVNGYPQLRMADAVAYLWSRKLLDIVT